jgi:large subunit ribosomal protein L24
MHVKKGDKVQILTGKDRGKTGKIVRVIPKHEQVIVEGMNMVTKHQRARKSNEKGQIVEHPMPIHVSNVKKAE